ncbi:hypothetical protein L3N51_01487 [Metallosphaera sp. J1]|uniref:metal-sulfur cluster assembly factor n=1 Tax=Metallosphaera javensis (ex Hofmann et al. 2022) TaxID=99938 RepID=UPI001EDECB32|nr:metal-sulfur cluster assembly factor [Metallosphaera javensis (ex Hofmann et al. 2022)]MCG3109197.1 hypothetical protein [Metallosphaera javensis (ex Hofmann et al. 2022)]
MKDRIVEILRQVYDPEIPVNIYDLGLVREIRVEDGRIFVRLIFTANRNCTLADMVAVQVKYRLAKAFPDYRVEVVSDYNAEWNIGYVTETGLLLLEEIYGKEAVEQLKNRKKVEDLVKNSLRINREDPIQFMRRAVEERYQGLKDWHERNRLLQ